MNDWNVTDGRLRRIERQQERKQAYTHFAQYDGQRAAVSCPPDTYLHIRGGWITTDYGEHLPSNDLDLHFGLNPGGTYGSNDWWGPSAFTNANYYKSAIVLRTDAWNDTTKEWGYYANVVWEPEVSTAACAEEWADYDLRYTLDKYYGYPICIIVCRNDGITGAMEPGVRGHILPLDAVNRGRSYLWRDIRPIMLNTFRTVTIGVSPAAPTCT